MGESSDKVFENRMRRAAKRQGFRLLKSRINGGGPESYWLFKASRGTMGRGVLEWVTLEQVEQYLAEQAKPKD